MPVLKQSFLILGLVLLVGLGLRLLAAAVSAPVDDAFITYRYSHNLAAGDGFTFNPGERVLGTTTPLFALLLVPFAAAGMPVDRVGTEVGIAADLVVILLLFSLLRRRWGDPVALAASSAYALSYAAIVACGNGMETQVFMAFVVGGIWAAAGGRAVVAAGLTALAALTRPEGFLLAGILGPFVLARTVRSRPREAVSAALVFAVVVGAWFAFATGYFGSPIPNSVQAKMRQAEVSGAQWLDFFVLRNPMILAAWGGALVGSVLAWRRRSPGALLLGGWLLVYSLFFLVSRPPFFGAWYFPPAALALVSLSAVAAAVILGGILRSPSRGAAVSVLLFAAAAGVALPWALDTARWNRTIAERVYRPMAEFVAGACPPQAVIHASDIGYLGYYSDRRILDAAALVTPDLWRYRAAHADDPDWDVAFVLERTPDYVVLPLQGLIYEKFLGGAFAAAYRPLRRFQAEGETDLHPPFMDSPRYGEDSRYVADFIVYERIPDLPD